MTSIIATFMSSFAQPVTFPGDAEIQLLAHHYEGNHFLALASNSEVYSWGEGESGQLGLGDTKYAINSFIVIQVTCLYSSDV